MICARPGCGNEFEKRAPNQRYCCHACQHEVHNRATWQKQLALRKEAGIEPRRGGRRRVITPDTERRIVVLRKRGLSTMEIAASLGMNLNTVYRALRRMDVYITPQRPPAVMGYELYVRAALELIT